MYLTSGLGPNNLFRASLSQKDLKIKKSSVRYPSSIFNQSFKINPINLLKLYVFIWGPRAVLPFLDQFAPNNLQSHKF